MALTHSHKKDIIAKHQKHKNDNGSALVQVAIMTERIEELQSHLDKHKKDHSSRRGLLKIVGRRRKMLNYIKLNESENYEKAVAMIKKNKKSSEAGIED